MSEGIGYGFREQVSWLLDANLIPPPPVVEIALAPGEDLYWTGTEWVTQTRPESANDGSGEVTPIKESAVVQDKGSLEASKATGITIGGATVSWTWIIIGILALLAFRRK